MEKRDYLSRQLITCLGNKRNLLDFIGLALERVMKRLDRKKLRLFDVFSGSGVVARYFKQSADLLLVNDVEEYAECVNRCYLANPSELPLEELRAIHRELCRRLETSPPRRGFIAELYAPEEDDRIRAGERVFFTSRNARYLDTARQYIEELAEPRRCFFIAPLLSEASVHANTSGVFKGFHKDPRTGQGRFGGSGADALARIRGNIELPFPLWSDFECPVRVYRRDANDLAPEAEEVDLAYLDPPYNQHPYSSNYFMLNLICRYRRPEELSPVSGIPPDWIRSNYNRRREAAAALADLVEKLRAKYLLISFNSEGFIGVDEMKAILEKAGRVEILETPYPVFRGGRNLRNRGLHIREYLYLVEKG